MVLKLYYEDAVVTIGQSVYRLRVHFYVSIPPKKKRARLFTTPAMRKTPHALSAYHRMHLLIEGGTSRKHGSNHPIPPRF